MILARDVAAIDGEHKLIGGAFLQLLFRLTKNRITRFAFRRS
jgi:hypothetical protein